MPTAHRDYLPDGYAPVHLIRTVAVRGLCGDRTSRTDATLRWEADDQPGWRQSFLCGGLLRDAIAGVDRAAEVPVRRLDEHRVRGPADPGDMVTTERRQRRGLGRAADHVVHAERGRPAGGVPGQQRPAVGR